MIEPGADVNVSADDNSTATHDCPTKGPNAALHRGAPEGEDPPQTTTQAPCSNADAATSSKSNEFLPTATTTSSSDAVVIDADHAQAACELFTAPEGHLEADPADGATASVSPETFVTAMITNSTDREITASAGNCETDSPASGASSSAPDGATGPGQLNTAIRMDLLEPPPSAAAVTADNKLSAAFVASADRTGTNSSAASSAGDSAPVGANSTLSSVPARTTSGTAGKAKPSSLTSRTPFKTTGGSSASTSQAPVKSLPKSQREAIPGVLAAAIAAKKAETSEPIEAPKPAALSRPWSAVVERRTATAEPVGATVPANNTLHSSGSHSTSPNVGAMPGPPFIAAAVGLALSKVPAAKSSASLRSEPTPQESVERWGRNSTGLCPSVSATLPGSSAPGTSSSIAASSVAGNAVPCATTPGPHQAPRERWADVHEVEDSSVSDSFCTIPDDSPSLKPRGTFGNRHNAAQQQGGRAHDRGRYRRSNDPQHRGDFAEPRGGSLGAEWQLHPLVAPGPATRPLHPIHGANAGRRQPSAPFAAGPKYPRRGDVPPQPDSASGFAPRYHPEPAAAGREWERRSDRPGYPEPLRPCSTTVKSHIQQPPPSTPEGFDSFTAKAAPSASYPDDTAATTSGREASKPYVPPHMRRQQEEKPKAAFHEDHHQPPNPTPPAVSKERTSPPICPQTTATPPRPSGQPASSYPSTGPLPLSQQVQPLPANSTFEPPTPGRPSSKTVASHSQRPFHPCRDVQSSPSSGSNPGSHTFQIPPSTGTDDPTQARRTSYSTAGQTGPLPNSASESNKVSYSNKSSEPSTPHKAIPATQSHQQQGTTYYYQSSGDQPTGAQSAIDGGSSGTAVVTGVPATSSHFHHQSQHQPTLWTDPNTGQTTPYAASPEPGHTSHDVQSLEVPGDIQQPHSYPSQQQQHPSQPRAYGDDVGHHRQVQHHQSSQSHSNLKSHQQPSLNHQRPAVGGISGPSPPVSSTWYVNMPTEVPNAYPGVGGAASSSATGAYHVVGQHPDGRQPGAAVCRTFMPTTTLGATVLPIYSQGSIHSSQSAGPYPTRSASAGSASIAGYTTAATTWQNNIPVAQSGAPAFFSGDQVMYSIHNPAACSGSQLDCSNPVEETAQQSYAAQRGGFVMVPRNQPNSSDHMAATASSSATGIDPHTRQQQQQHSRHTLMSSSAPIDPYASTTNAPTYGMSTTPTDQQMPTSTDFHPDTPHAGHMMGSAPHDRMSSEVEFSNTMQHRQAMPRAPNPAAQGSSGSTSAYSAFTPMTGGAYPSAAYVAGDSAPPYMSQHGSGGVYLCGSTKDLRGMTGMHEGYPAGGRTSGSESYEYCGGRDAPGTALSGGYQLRHPGDPHGPGSGQTPHQPHQTEQPSDIYHHPPSQPHMSYSLEGGNMAHCINPDGSSQYTVRRGGPTGGGQGNGDQPPQMGARDQQRSYHQAATSSSWNHVGPSLPHPVSQDDPEFPGSAAKGQFIHPHSHARVAGPHSAASATTLPRPQNPFYEPNAPQQQVIYSMTPVAPYVQAHGAQHRPPPVASSYGIVPAEHRPYSEGSTRTMLPPYPPVQNQLPHTDQGLSYTGHPFGSQQGGGVQLHPSSFHTSAQRPTVPTVHTTDMSKRGIGAAENAAHTVDRSAYEGGNVDSGQPSVEFQGRMQGPPNRQSVMGAANNTYQNSGSGAPWARPSGRVSGVHEGAGESGATVVPSAPEGDGKRTSPVRNRHGPPKRQIADYSNLDPQRSDGYPRSPLGSNSVDSSQPRHGLNGNNTFHDPQQQQRDRRPAGWDGSQAPGHPARMSADEVTTGEATPTPHGHTERRQPRNQAQPFGDRAEPSHSQQQRSGNINNRQAASVATTTTRQPLHDPLSRPSTTSQGITSKMASGTSRTPPPPYIPSPAVVGRDSRENHQSPRGGGGDAISRGQHPSLRRPLEGYCNSQSNWRSNDRSPFSNHPSPGMSDFSRAARSTRSFEDSEANRGLSRRGGYAAEVAQRGNMDHTHDPCLPPDRHPDGTPDSRAKPDQQTSSPMERSRGGGGKDELAAMPSHPYIAQFPSAAVSSSGGPSSAVQRNRKLPSGVPNTSTNDKYLPPATSMPMRSFGSEGEPTVSGEGTPSPGGGNWRATGQRKPGGIGTSGVSGQNENAKGVAKRQAVPPRFRANGPPSKPQDSIIEPTHGDRRGPRERSEFRGGPHGRPASALPLDHRQVASRGNQFHPRDESSTHRAENYRTQICRHYVKGTCNWHDRCNYMHPDDADLPSERLPRRLTGLGNHTGGGHDNHGMFQGRRLSGRNAAFSNPQHRTENNERLEEDFGGADGLTKLSLVDVDTSQSTTEFAAPVGRSATSQTRAEPSPRGTKESIGSIEASGAVPNGKLCDLPEYDLSVARSGSGTDPPFKEQRTGSGGGRSATGSSHPYRAPIGQVRKILTDNCALHRNPTLVSRTVGRQTQRDMEMTENNHHTTQPPAAGECTSARRCGGATDSSTAEPRQQRAGTPVAQQHASKQTSRGRGASSSLSSGAQGALVWRRKEAVDKSSEDIPGPSRGANAVSASAFDDLQGQTATGSGGTRTGGATTESKGRSRQRGRGRPSPINRGNDVETIASNDPLPNNPFADVLQETRCGESSVHNIQSGRSNVNPEIAAMGRGRGGPRQARNRRQPKRAPCP